MALVSIKFVSISLASGIIYSLLLCISVCCISDQFSVLISQSLDLLKGLPTEIHWDIIEYSAYFV